MSATTIAQRPPATAGEERTALSAMAFVSDSVTLSRVSADLFNMTLGKANVRDGTLDSALAISDGPRRGACHGGARAHWRRDGADRGRRQGRQAAHAVGDRRARRCRHHDSGG